MNPSSKQRRPAGPWAAFRRRWPLLALVMMLGLVVNLLSFVTPLFAMLVYDRVVATQSLSTLAWLSAMAAGAIVIAAMLDHVRRRILARVGLAALMSAESGRRADAALADRAAAPFVAGSIVGALDALWVPIYVAALWLIHPWLGMLALAATLALMLAGVIRALAPALPAEEDPRAAERLAAGALAVQSARPARLRLARLGEEMAAGDTAGWIAGAEQVIRGLAQAGIIALAALLVVGGQISAGAIIATSVMLGRALSLADGFSQRLGPLRSALAAIGALGDRARRAPPKLAGQARPDPAAGLAVTGLAVAGSATASWGLQGVTLVLAPGRSLCITGPSGAGKSLFLAALCGAVDPAAGQVRFRGLSPLAAAMADGDVIGYLPHFPDFVPGSIADNIDPTGEAGPARIEAAARLVGLHDQVLALRAGYQMALNPRDPHLPGSLLQKIALARTILWRPGLVLLDEPANNLDTAGIEALGTAIRALCDDGAIVVLATQRPAIARLCDTRLSLMRGRPGGATEPGPARERAAAQLHLPAAE